MTGTEKLEGYDASAGRQDLNDFEAAQPENFWQADPHLRRVLTHWVGAARLAEWEPTLDRFGGDCAGAIDLAVRASNLTANLPRVDRFSSYGDRLEEVDHHPSFHLAGRGIYGSGMMRALVEPDGNARALALFYLSSCSVIGMVVYPTLLLPFLCHRLSL